MPRPLGLTHGEGRYKGLGGTSSPGFDAYNNATDYFGSWANTGVTVLGYPSGDPLNQSSMDLDYYNAVSWFQANPTANPATMGRPPQATIGEWIQKNQGFLLVGGIVGLLLLRR